MTDCLQCSLKQAKFFLALSILSLSFQEGCGIPSQRGRIPPEIESLVASISDDITFERYDKIYRESSELWKKDVTPEQSAQVLKTLNEKLGKVESRLLHTA